MHVQMLELDGLDTWTKLYQGLKRDATSNFEHPQSTAI